MPRLGRNARWAVGFCAVLFTLTLATPRVPAETAATGPLAEVNGEAITARDLEQAAGAKLAELEEQIYELKRRELDILIADRLFAQEAAKRGVSVSTLLDEEITAMVPLLTEQEIDTFYEASKARRRGEEASLRQQIRARLQQEKLFARRDQFVESLRSRSKILVHLPPPPVVRVDVSTDGAPSRGAADAPVKLVEFSDFHCPFCKRAQGTLQELLKRYPGKLSLVYRDFPLDQLHPQARRAAEAARCANDQGKFWEYHDLLFEQPPQATSESLQQHAAHIGLDIAVFDRCLSSRAHSDAVQRDIDEGTRLGITGTPAFFINGRRLVGAQPLDAFTRVIDEELARP
jgi:protein-disulfide isomerase